MSETLLVVTTANHSEYTLKCIQSLKQCRESFDLLVIDDASDDNTLEMLTRNHIQFISKKSPQGLTHSWNLAYEYFLNHSYQHLILANNDILVPNGALTPILSALEKFVLVGPTTHKAGLFPALYDRQIIPNLRDSPYNPAEPIHFQKIQDALTESGIKDYQPVDILNGFFLAMNRNISNYEFRNGTLFDPKRINIKNEDDLCMRIKGNKAVCLKSFIFHYKGISVNGNAFGKFVPSNTQRELTWQQLNHIKRNPFRRIWFALSSNLKYALKFLFR